ncbi:MAG: Ig-like domain-containing protein, partial [Pseudomonadota bacterium]
AFVAANTAGGGTGPVDITAQIAAQALGEAASAQILDVRADDGFDDEVVFIGENTDGQWRPTGPAYLNAQNPQWADLETFALASDDQFRPDAPPSLLGDTITDDAYANDLERVRALGEAESTDRTDDQTQIARFWADGAGTETPPGHWNRIAAQVSEAEGLSLSQSAELMLKLNLALADAAIAAWDTKFTYDFWRPVTVLSEGGRVDATQIVADPDWDPLLTTPAHPEYVSGHSTYSGAAATVLTDTFGEDYTFSDNATTTSGEITRDFDSFWHAATEGGESRIFGGIHFDFSNVTGLALGTEVANWVLQSFDPLNDVVDPTIVLTNLDPDAVNASPVIEGIVGDNLSGTLSLRANVDGLAFFDVAIGANGTFSFGPGALSDGQHTVEFIAQDAAGNTGVAAYEFTLTTQAPTIALTGASISDANTALADGARIIGDIDVASGTRIAVLTVQIDGGAAMPLAFGEDGSFDAQLEIGALAPGAHTITVRAVDNAGNESVETIDTTLAERPAFRVVDLTPNDRESEVGATIHPFVQFNREVDLATLNSDSFFAVTATGAKIAATITPLNDGTGAWMFFENPLPGSTAIELIVDGDLILAADGASLDGDADGTPGGALVQRFTTVALEGLETTTLSGRVVDPGDDLFMMTPDDFIAGPAGITDYANHQYRSPIEGAEVYVLGRPDLKVFTDADGSFELTGLPSGKVKIVVDGRTATNAPDDIYWPEMVVDVEIRPGQANTIMGGMGPLEAQLERQEDQAFFLPRIPTAALTEVPDDQPITIRPVSGAGTNLTQEQFDLISLEVQPGSMIDAQGNPIANPELGLAIVPSEMVVDMLPDGVPIPPLFLTIQGPDGGVFTEEAVLTIPNVFGLPPGDKTEFFSYDHQTGLLVINGVGTVSEDGTFIQTDPGSGILQPGWNGPIRVSRILLDPQLPCPPGTTHPENTDPNANDITATDIVDVTNTVVGNYGALKNLNDAQDLVSLSSRNGPVDAVGNVTALIDDGNRFAKTIEDMYVAYYTGDTGDVGGQADAGYWGIMGTKLVRDVGRTTLHSFSAIVQNVPGLEEFRPVSKAIDTTIAGVDLIQTLNENENPAEPVTRLVNKVKNKVSDTADNGIQGKVAPNTPEAQPFEDFEPELDEKITRLEELEDQLDELQIRAQEVKEAAEDLKRINEEVLEPILEEMRAPTQEEADRLFGTETGTSDDSEWSNAFERFVEASIAAQEVGNYDTILFEIYGILQSVLDEHDDLYGDLPDTISLSDLDVPPSQVDGEYEIAYGPVQYILMTNLDTGEEQRITMKSGEQPLVPTSPGANYSLEIFDPVSGFTGATTFVGPRPVVINSLTNFELLPSAKPILNATAAEPIGPGGLTEQQAHIVGADFGEKDSLLPGTSITDRQALISGLGSSPGSVNLNGVTGQLTLDGTAEAVAIGSTSAGGAGLTAYVATG